MDPDEEKAEDLDTDRLIVRVQQGHPDDFAQIYSRYFGRVYSYIRGLFKDPHEAEDATQEVFIKVMKALPGFKNRSEPFRGWLFVIARNHAISELRKQGRVELVEPAELAELASLVADTAESESESESELTEAELAVLQWLSDDDLNVFFDRLPLAHRQVLALRYTLDLPAAQIGETLGLSAVNVRAIHSRSIIFLRKRLKAMGRTPSGPGDRIEAASRTREAYVLRKRRFTLKD